MLKVARATWPTVWVRPLVKVPLMVPSDPISKLFRVPVWKPSAEAASWLEVPLRAVVLLKLRLKVRLGISVHRYRRD